MCLFIICGCLFQTAISTKAAAEGKKQVVRVGYADTSAFLYKNTDGTYSGAAYEYLRALAMYNGWEYEFVSGTEQEGLERIKKGELDLYLPVRKTKKNKQEFTFSKESFCDSQVALVTDESKEIGYEEYEKLDGMVIGCYAEEEDKKSLENILETKGCHVTFQTFQDGKSLIEALKKGKIDAALDKNLREVQEYKVVARLGLQEEYVVSGKNNTDVLMQFEEAKKQLDNTDPYLFAELDEKYQRQSGNQVPAFTTEEKEFIAKNPNITVILGPGDYNRIFKEKKNGSEELLEEMSKVSQLHFQVIKAKSLEEMLDKVENGQGDIVLAVNNDYEWADEKNLWLTQDYFIQQTYEVRRNVGSDKDIKTIAVTKGSYLEEQIRKKKNVTIIPCESNEDAFEKVYQGEADALVCPQLVGEYFSAKSKYAKFNYKILEGQINEYCIGVSKKCDSRLISVLDKTIAAIPLESLHQMFSMAGIEQKVTLQDYFYANPLKVVLILTCGMVFLALFVVTVVFLNMMKKKNQQLVKANQAKKDFLSHMSHEMKTPLNGIRGCLELTQNSSPQEQKEYIEKALMSAQHLDSMIGNMLDMVQLESGSIQMLRTWVNLEQFVKEIEVVSEEEMKKKHLTFTCELGEMQYYEIWADKVRLYQAILNLIQNAIHYTLDEGRIELKIIVQRTDATHAKIAFSVIDNGIGMNSEFIDLAAEPFSQQEGDESLRGSGLGLAITKEIARLAGGCLKMDSKEGKGTTAVIEFPTEIRVKKEMIESLYAVPKKEYDEKDFEQLKGKRALVVEDNEINAFVARKYLQEMNIETELAYNGKEAFEKFKNAEVNYYDMIFMDLMMPVMDGLEATKMIRSLERSDAGQIPIIAMSASDFAVNQEMFEACHLDYQLKKPYGKRELWNAIVSCENHSQTGIL